MATNEKCKKCEYYVCSFEDIQDQPTAYDVDAVVEQLESEAKKFEHLAKHEHDIGDTLLSSEFFTKSEAFSEAIKIVKGGME
jgi:hypothetical protein